MKTTSAEMSVVANTYAQVKANITSFWRFIMVGKYKVITLCGSTRFKDDFERINKELTLLGNIVISVGCFGHAGDTFTEEQKVMLDDIHKRKIDMADAIYVINKNGYIGQSTRSEIKYAIERGKQVIFMEDDLI